MVNNFTLVDKYLESKPGCLYPVTIIRRIKDIHLKRDEFQNQDTIVKTFFVRDKVDLYEYRSEIMTICNVFGARAYVYLTPVDVKGYLKRLEFFFQTDNIPKLEHYFRYISQVEGSFLFGEDSVKGTGRVIDFEKDFSLDSKIVTFDIDGDENLKDFYKILSENDISLLEEVPSLSGKTAICLIGSKWDNNMSVIEWWWNKIKVAGSSLEHIPGAIRGGLVNLYIPGKDDIFYSDIKIKSII